MGFEAVTTDQVGARHERDDANRATGPRGLVKSSGEAGERLRHLHEEPLNHMVVCGGSQCRHDDEHA
jgi:hypothetical protein